MRMMREIRSETTVSKLRAKIDSAESQARLELQCSRRCVDPRNIEYHRREAATCGEMATEYRRELAILLLRGDR
jgi:hypothetical protein